MTAPPAVRLRPWPLPVARQLVAGAPVAVTARARWHAGYPTADTVDALAMVLGAYEVDGPLVTEPRWWVHEIEVGRAVVGDVGFHGPPAVDGPQEVEIGYAVVPPWRGRGVATRAVRLLVELAWRTGADTLHAETAADNPASHAVLRHSGFAEVSLGRWRLERPR